MFLKSLKKCVYKFTKFISASGLAWQAALKKTGVELDLLKDVNLLLMVEKEY